MAASDEPRAPQRYGRRYCTLAAGLVIMALGVALTVRALIGTTPISALPVVLAEAWPVTVGQVTFAMNMVFVLVQVALLRRDFPPIQWLQLPVSLAFGVLVDAWLWALRDLAPADYWLQLGLSVLGSLIAGVGIWLEVLPRVVLMSGEGVVTAITKVTGRNFGTMKILFDSTLVALAILASFLLLGHLVGVREGTVIGAVLVGATVKLLMRRLPGLGRWLGVVPASGP